MFGMREDLPYAYDDIPPGDPGLKPPKNLICKIVGHCWRWAEDNWWPKIGGEGKAWARNRWCKRCGLPQIAVTKTRPSRSN